MERSKKPKNLGQRLQDLSEYDVKAASYKKYFFESMATMLASGIDIRTILNDLEQDTKSKYLKKMIRSMRVEVENGTSISKVIEHFELVPEHYLALIRIGEQSGNLPQNMEAVVSQIERDRDFQSRIRSASLYPSMVGIVLLVVSFVMMTFVLPRITGVYESLNVELPLITQIMIAVGKFLDRNVDTVVPAFAVFMIIMIYLLYFNKAFKNWLNQVMFRLPGLGRMTQEIELARLGFLLSSLLSSGISLTEGFRLLESASNIKQYTDLYKYLGFYVEKGYTLDKMLLSYPHIDNLIPVYPRQLMINGEKSRRLAENLQKVGELYLKKNELTIKDLGTMFEPALLLIIWIGVTLFAVGVIVPIYSILGGISDVASGTNVQPVIETPVVTEAPGINTDINNLQPDTDEQ